MHLFAHLSFIFLINHSCFLHHSHWSLALLSIAFCAFLSWFSHLFSLFLAYLSVSFRIFLVAHHIRSFALASLSVASRTSLLLIAFPSCAYGTFFTCSPEFNLLLLTHSFTSHAFTSWFFYLFWLLLEPILIASHTLFGCCSCFRQLLLVPLYIASYILNCCFFHCFELFSCLSVASRTFFS
jgi:hypothetical protein